MHVMQLLHWYCRLQWRWRAEQKAETDCEQMDEAAAMHLDEQLFGGNRPNSQAAKCEVTNNISNRESKQNDYRLSSAVKRA